MSKKDKRYQTTKVKIESEGQWVRRETGAVRPKKSAVSVKRCAKESGTPKKYSQIPKTLNPKPPKKK